METANADDTEVVPPERGCEERTVRRPVPTFSLGSRALADGGGHGCRGVRAPTGIGLRAADAVLPGGKTRRFRKRGLAQSGGWPDWVSVGTKSLPQAPRYEEWTVVPPGVGATGLDGACRRDLRKPVLPPGWRSGAVRGPVP